MCMYGFEALSGFKVAVNDIACVQKKWVQYRFPKQKSHRRVKKWFKNKKNWRDEETHNGLQVGDCIYVSSKMYNELKKSA